MKLRRLAWYITLAVAIVSVAALEVYDRSTVTLYVDNMNECMWHKGEIYMQTAVNGIVGEMRVKRQDVPAIMTEAAAHNRCVATDPSI